MRGIWLVLLAAMGAVVWFFLGDSLGLGSERAADAERSNATTLVEGDDSVTLSAQGGGAANADGTAGASDAPTGDPMALGGFVVRGRLVNETRHPVAGTVCGLVSRARTGANDDRRGTGASKSRSANATRRPCRCAVPCWHAAPAT